MRQCRQGEHFWFERRRRVCAEPRSVLPRLVRASVSTLRAQAPATLATRMCGRSLIQSVAAAILGRVSAENVEIVRRWLETLSAAPEEAGTSAADFWDADVDYYPVRKFPEARPCHGPDEVMQFLAGYVEAWSGYDYAVQDLIEVGDDRVLVCATLRADETEASALPCARRSLRPWQRSSVGSRYSDECSSSRPAAGAASAGTPAALMLASGTSNRTPRTPGQSRRLPSGVPRTDA